MPSSSRVRRTRAPNRSASWASRPEDLGRPVSALTLAATPGGQRDQVGQHTAAAAVPLGRDEQVVLDGEPPEDLDPLEGAPQAGASPPLRTGAGEVVAVHLDPTFVGDPHTGDHVEERRLPGTVGADQPADLTGRDPEGHAVEGGDAPEPHADVGDDECIAFPFSNHRAPCLSCGSRRP